MSQPYEGERGEVIIPDEWWRRELPGTYSPNDLHAAYGRAWHSVGYPPEVWSKGPPTDVKERMEGYTTEPFGEW